MKNFCFGGRLKGMCFATAYLSLISGVISIATHLLTVAIVTNGFQCVASYENFRGVRTWIWLQLLQLLNLGVHGFYPFPYDFSDYMVQSINVVPKCYPGMFHVRIIDVFNLAINAIWLYHVVSFVIAVHKKDPKNMRMFFGVSLLKLAVQVIFFPSVPVSPGVKYEGVNNRNICIEYGNLYWFFKALDICLAVMYIVIIKQYIVVLTAEKRSEDGQPPPSYFECLMGTAKKAPSKQEDKVQVATDGTHTLAGEKKEAV